MIAKQRLHQLCTTGLQNLLGAWFFFVNKRRLLDFASGHIISEFFLCKFGCIPCACVLSIAEDRKSLCDLEHLVQLMGHEQNRDILLLKIADDIEQGANFLFRDRRCGLIHNDQLCII